MSSSTMGALCTLGVVACSGPASDQSLGKVVGDLSADEGNATALRSGESCDELLARLQNELIVQVRQVAEQARVAGTPYYGGGVFIDDVAPTVGVSPPVEVAPVASPPPAPAPVRFEGSGVAGFSDTTSLVPGVESSDFVKAVGDRIYLVQGTTLFVLNAASAAATELLASVPIEGQAFELSVDGDRLVVFSTIYGPLPGTDDVYSPYYYYYPNYVKLTVLDAQSSTFDVLRESYVEGSYASSQRRDGVVRTVVQQSSKAQLDYPSVSYVDIFGHPRSQAEIDLQVDLWVLLTLESIEDSEIDDYLPSTYERVGGALVEQPQRCADYLLPESGSSQFGVTTVVSLDLRELGAPLRGTSVLGYADSVYSGAESIILRQTDYGDYTSEAPSVSTRLHRFAIDGASATYTGTAKLAGFGPGGYGIDEHAGVIRALMLEERYVIDADGGGGSIYRRASSYLLTLSADTMSELGRTPDLGPERYAYGAQFFGDRGYVTSYVGDTGLDFGLTVVDLSDPAAPSIEGTASVQGYTGLLYPLSAGSLLGFAQSVDPTGFDQPFSLQLLDVSDAGNPTVKHELSLSGYSEAFYDPRALTFHPHRNLIAYPVQDYNTGANSLQVVRVSPSAGFTLLGNVVPPAAELSLIDCLVLLGYPTDPDFLEQLEQDPAFTEALLGQCRSYTQEYVRRGLLRADDLVAIGSRSVSTYSLGALSGPPLSQVSLPVPGYPIGVPIPLAAPARPSE